MVDLTLDASDSEYSSCLKGIPGLADLVNKRYGQESEDYRLFLMELALHGLAEYSVLSKHILDEGFQFKDLISSMLDIEDHTPEDI